MGRREEDQSPTRKRAREDSPDNGSQHEYTSDRGRVKARAMVRTRGRAVLGVEEEPGVGALLGEGAKLGEGGKPEERAELKEGVQGGERLVGEGAVPLVIPQMKSKSKDRKRNPTLILMILMMVSMYSLLLLHIVHLEFILNDQSCGVA